MTRMGWDGMGWGFRPTTPATPSPSPARARMMEPKACRFQCGGATSHNLSVPFFTSYDLILSPFLLSDTRFHTTAVLFIYEATRYRSCDWGKQRPSIAIWTTAHVEELGAYRHDGSTKARKGGSQSSRRNRNWRQQCRTNATTAPATRRLCS